MKKRFLIPIILVIFIITGYMIGPKPPKAVLSNEWPNIPSIENLEEYVLAKEMKYKIRPENGAQIIWAPSFLPFQKTEYVVLYLHGFSASHKEGYPVNQNLAQYLGANLYLSRLAGHGLDTSAQLSTFYAEAAWKDAKEALAIAEKIGKKVIVLSTSTGSTFALQLAATFPDKVHALINLSPNLAIADPTAKLLDDPWGLQIAKWVIGENRYVNQDTNQAYRYWDSLYTVNALVELQRLLTASMTNETFKKVQCPVLTLYYYENEENKDQVIDVNMIPKAHALFSTADGLKPYIALAQPKNHVLASPVKSKNIDVVEAEILKFCQETLNITQ